VKVDGAIEDGVRMGSGEEYVIPRKRFLLFLTAAGQEAMSTLRVLRSRWIA